MGGTLLNYAVSANQDPIEASPQTGNPSQVNLMIVVSNPGGSYVDCKTIEFSFLEGTSARDFFSDATGISTSAPAGWKMTQSGANFTAKPDPDGSGLIGPNGLAFFLSSIAVNEEPGTTEMTITETTTTETATTNVGVLTYPLAKFPAQFNVGPLLANPLTIKQGENTTLSWNGSGGATYALQYLDADGNTVNITETTDGQPLPPTGSYTISNLQANTTFYLIVSVTSPGGDSPPTAQREVTVSVATTPVQINSFDVSTTTVSMPGDKVTFTWDVTAATIVQFGDGNVEGNSTTVQVYETTTYTLQAFGGGGPVTASITITVAPVTINSFNSNLTSVYGQNNDVPVTLTWDVQSASQILLNGNVITGTSAVVNVNEETTFTLAATGYPKDVYESLTVTIEEIDLQVSADGSKINCSFGANVGNYTVILFIIYGITGIKEAIMITNTFQSKVSHPGVIQLSMDLGPLMSVISVEAQVLGFPSGAIAAQA
jgi:plastocyanin